jgi:DNA polymerase-3 subunit alpha/error-prone DNA polymerase
VLFAIKVEVISLPYTVTKMAKMPLLPTRVMPVEQQFSTPTHSEDVSMTHRAPYPQEHEIGLPRHKMISTD